MKFLRRLIPPYLYHKANLIWLVVFTAVFALLFINIYTPFTSTQWYPLSRFEYFLYSSLIILTGIMVVVISRAIMYFYTRNHSISYGLFAIWVLLEITSMALFYTLYSYTLDETRPFWIVFQSSFRNTSLILLLPYFIAILFFSLQEKARLLKSMELENAATQEPLSFRDENGDIRIVLQPESLLYMESSDNYVSVCYKSAEGIRTYLLRNTLKAIEGQLDHTRIVRCHRSYIINLDQVKVAQRTKEGFILHLDIPKVPDIPVSKSYADKINFFKTLV